MFVNQETLCLVTESPSRVVARLPQRPRKVGWPARNFLRVRAVGGMAIFQRPAKAPGSAGGYLL
jgi:hypothetical protein